MTDPLERLTDLSLLVVVVSSVPRRG